MGLKDTLKAIATFPAKAVGYVADKLFGVDRYEPRRAPDGKLIYNTKDEIIIDHVNKHGLFSYLSTALTSFIARHQTIIAAAFWISLALTAAAVLTAFLWPAALTAVVTFSVAGFSIAGIVGANLAAQLGVIGALAAVGSVTAAVIGVHVAAAASWAFNGAKGWLNKASSSEPGQPRRQDGKGRGTGTGNDDSRAINDSTYAMSLLGGSSSNSSTIDMAPSNKTLRFDEAPQAPVVNNQATQSLSL